MKNSCAKFCGIKQNLQIVANCQDWIGKKEKKKEIKISLKHKSKRNIYQIKRDRTDERLKIRGIKVKRS